ncbi:MAG: hypothetical protein ACOY0T_24515 [Myxococcota bacterium]
MLLAFVTLTPFVAACRKKPEPAAVVRPSPPPRPREVVAELTVPDPHALWPRLRSLAGPFAEVLPQAPELAVAAIAGVPALSAGSFELHSPLVLATVSGDAAGVVVGVHLQNGPELLANVTTGARPSHRAERKGALAQVFNAGAQGSFAFGLVDDTLLLGPEPAVQRVGEYVARALRPQASTRGPITLITSGESLKAWVTPTLRRAWLERRAELGAALDRERATHARPADFGEPEVLLAWLDEFVQAGVALLESVREMRGVLDVDAQRLDLELRLMPEPNGAAQAFVSNMALGNGEAIKSLPANSAFALLLRRRLEPQPKPGLERLRALFAGRLASAESAQLEQGLTNLALGRGEVDAFALLPDLGVVWRGPVNDANQLHDGVSTLLSLLTHKPFSELLAASAGRPQLLRKPSQRRAEARIDRAELVLRPAAPSAKAKRLELASSISEGEFVITAAPSGAGTLDRALAGAEANLGADPALAPFIAAASDVSWLALCDLARLGMALPESRAPLSLAARSREGGLSLSLRVSDAALRALVARGLGR